MTAKNQLVKTGLANNPQIIEVEKIFVGSFQTADVLFVKPENLPAMALKLPKDFLQLLVRELKTKRNR